MLAIESKFHWQKIESNGCVPAYSFIWQWLHAQHNMYGGLIPSSATFHSLSLPSVIHFHIIFSTSIHLLLPSTFPRMSTVKTPGAKYQMLLAPAANAYNILALCTFCNAGENVYNIVVMRNGANLCARSHIACALAVCGTHCSLNFLESSMAKQLQPPFKTSWEILLCIIHFQMYM